MTAPAPSAPVAASATALARDTYDTGLTVRDALQDYFARNEFSPDGGYADKWVRIQVGPIYLAFPNTAGRVQAIRYHDIHHIATGYQTTLQGEAEVGAWELATGCAHFRTAWVLNGIAFAMGVLRHHAAVERAWARGRRTRNVYGWDYEAALIDKPVGALRRELRTDEPEPEPTAEDKAAFRKAALLFSVVCGLPALSVYAGPPLLLIWWLLT